MIMKHHKTSLLLALWPLLSAAQALSERDQLTYRLLSAVEYGRLQRAVITRDCKAKPQFANVPACAAIYNVTDRELAELAIPYMNSHVSKAQAKEALAFWTSREGAAIQRKLQAAIGASASPGLSAAEYEALDRFNQSDAGVAMSSMAKDRQASVALIQAIGERGRRNSR